MVMVQNDCIPFHQIQKCCLQTLSVWKSLKFVVWERVKTALISTALSSVSCLLFRAIF